jgi:hypothetical protein
MPPLSRPSLIALLLLPGLLLADVGWAAEPPKPLEAPHARYSGPKPPWRARRRRAPTGRAVLMRIKGQGLMDLSRWPAEPKSPPRVEATKLARAIRAICGWMPPKRPMQYATWILESSREFSVDPFVVAALIYRQSLCVPNRRADYGAGLTGINVRMHSDFVRRKRYRYWVLASGRWQRKLKPMPRYLLFPPNARRSRSNIYFAAALLSIYDEQHASGVCKAFGSVPHRHAVSHFIWGDRVKDAGAEDRVLRARRRLLLYYADGAKTQPNGGRYEKLALRFPLDAPPRKITSGLGDKRADGKRRHKGLDFSSTFGEPVRAIAAGKVIIAGIDARYGPSRNMPFEKAKAVPAAKLGAGGLYVMVRHAGGLVSAYMHLSRYDVRAGQRVEQGQLLGLVGRTGMKKSSAHLHFELRIKGTHIDPTSYLGSDVFAPEATYLGRKLRWERWRQRRRAAYRRWQATKKTRKPAKKRSKR